MDQGDFNVNSQERMHQLNEWQDEMGTPEVPITPESKELYQEIITMKIETSDDYNKWIKKVHLLFPLLIGTMIGLAMFQESESMPREIAIEMLQWSYCCVTLFDPKDPVCDLLIDSLVEESVSVTRKPIPKKKRLQNFISFITEGMKKMLKNNTKEPVADTLTIPVQYDSDEELNREIEQKNREENHEAESTVPRIIGLTLQRSDKAIYYYNEMSDADRQLLRQRPGKLTAKALFDLAIRTGNPEPYKNPIDNKELYDLNGTFKGHPNL